MHMFKQFKNAINEDIKDIFASHEHGLVIFLLHRFTLRRVSYKLTITRAKLTICKKINYFLIKNPKENMLHLFK